MTLYREDRTQGVRHGFGVAEIAHVFRPLLERSEKCQRLALLTRFVRAKGAKGFDTFTVPARGRKQQAVSALRERSLRSDLVSIVRDRRLTARSRSQFEHCLARRAHGLGKPRELAQQRTCFARIDH